MGLNEDEADERRIPYCEKHTAACKIIIMHHRFSQRKITEGLHIMYPSLEGI